MVDAKVNGVVRDLRRSRAILAELLPTLLRRARAAKVALEAMGVLYPGLAAEAEEMPDLDQVEEWVIVGRARDGRDVVTLSVPQVNQQDGSLRHRSRLGSTVEDLIADGDSVSRRDVWEPSPSFAGEADAGASRAVSAEPVEIRELTDWALKYLRQHPGEHFSVRRLREQAIEQLELVPEQVDHDRFRLALIEARTQDPALVQPNRKAWMYRRRIGSLSEGAE